MSNKDSTRFTHFKKQPLLIVLCVLLVLSLTGGSFFAYKYWKTKTSSQATATLVERLRKTIDLPTEQPTIFTIADKSKLANKKLAERVENGDTLIFFKTAQRVVVYRPSSQKVVEMLSIE